MKLNVAYVMLVFVFISNAGYKRFRRDTWPHWTERKPRCTRGQGAHWKKWHSRSGCESVSLDPFVFEKSLTYDS